MSTPTNDPQQPVPQGDPYAAQNPPPAGGYYPAGPTAVGYPAPGQPGAYPPPGQPGAYPPPGEPAAFGAFPPAPPAKKPRPAWIRPVLIVGVAAVVGIGIWLFQRDDVQNAKVGDCINMRSSSDFKIVDCASSDSQYKVVSVQDGSASSTCSDADVDSSIEQTGKNPKSFCLQVELKVGDCVTDGGQWTECANSLGSSYKAIEILASTTDPAGCPSETVYQRAYTRDNKVVCLVDNK